MKKHEVVLLLVVLAFVLAVLFFARIQLDRTIDALFGRQGGLHLSPPTDTGGLVRTAHAQPPDGGIGGLMQLLGGPWWREVHEPGLGFRITRFEGEVPVRTIQVNPQRETRVSAWVVSQVFVIETPTGGPIGPILGLAQRLTTEGRLVPWPISTSDTDVKGIGFAEYVKIREANPDAIVEVVAVAYTSDGYVFVGQFWPKIEPDCGPFGGQICMYPWSPIGLGASVEGALGEFANQGIVEVEWAAYGSHGEVDYGIAGPAEASLWGHRWVTIDGQPFLANSAAIRAYHAEYWPGPRELFAQLYMLRMPGGIGRGTQLDTGALIRALTELEADLAHDGAATK